MIAEKSLVIRVCRLNPTGGMELLDIDNTVLGLQAALGGHAEVIQLPPVLAWRDLIGLVDDEGLLRELPYNTYAPRLGQVLVGPVLILHSVPPEFTDLTDDDLQVITYWFNETPEPAKP